MLTNVDDFFSAGFPGMSGVNLGGMGMGMGAGGAMGGGANQAEPGEFKPEHMMSE